MAKKEYRFGFVIEGNAEKGTKALRKVRQEVDQLDKQAGKASKGTKQWRDEINRKNKTLDQHGRMLSRTKNMVLGLVGAYVGIQGVRSFFGGVIHEQEQLQRNLLRTEQLIQTTGRSAEVSAESLHQRARELAAATLESTEGIMQAQQTLMTFRNVRGEVFDQAIEGALDLSRAMKTDLNSATLQLAKALEDPITGMTALTRSGTVFTQKQKDMVRQMVETGRTAEAQRFILEELAAQYGGVARKEAEGFAGAQDSMAQALQEAKIAIGEKFDFLGRLENGYRSTTSVLTEFTERLETGDLDGHIQTIFTAGEALAVLMAGRFAGGMAAGAAAMISAEGAAIRLRSALLFLGGPAGIVTVAAGASWALVEVQKRKAEAAWDVVESIEAQTDALEKLSLEQLGKRAREINDSINATKRQIQEEERLLGILVEGSAAYDEHAEKLRRLNLELEAQQSNFQLVRTHIERAKKSQSEHNSTVVTAADVAGYYNEILAEFDRRQSAASDSTSEATDKIDEMIQGLAEERAMLHMTAREQQIYNFLKGKGKDATEEQRQAVIAQINALHDEREALRGVNNQAGETGDGLNDLGDTSSDVATDMQEEWRRTRDAFSETFADLVQNGDSAFDALATSFERMLLKMVGDLVASGIMSFLTGRSGGSVTDILGGAIQGSGVAGEITKAGLSRFAPGIASSLGFSGALTSAAATTGFGAGAGGSLTTLAPGLSTAAGWTVPTAGTGTAASAGGLLGGIKTAFSAIPGWGWAAMGAAALTAAFSKKSTPSFNAGLLASTPGPGVDLSRTFEVAPFESGLQPTGFARRVDRTEAEKVIEFYRQLDSEIMKVVRQAGFDLKVTGLEGFSETGQGRGQFFGLAGEDGDVVITAEEAAEKYARELISRLRGQVDDNALNDILRAGGVDQMISALERLAKDSDKASRKAADGQEILIDRQREYADDLETIQRLYTEGTKEYAEALNRLNSAYRSLSLGGGGGGFGRPVLDPDVEVGGTFGNMQLVEAARKMFGPGGHPNARFDDFIQTTGFTEQQVKEFARSQVERHGGLNRGAVQSILSMGLRHGLGKSEFIDIFDLKDDQIKRIEAMGFPGFAGGGIATGPRSGYPAMLHGPEAIVPLPDGRSIPVEVKSDGSANEIRALRSEVTQLKSITSQLLSRMVIFSERQAETIEKWDVIGMPPGQS